MMRRRSARAPLRARHSRGTIAHGAAVPGAITIVIADTYPVFRDGMRKAIESETGIRIVGETGDGLQAMQLVTAMQPDVLLLDSGIGLMSAFDILSEMRAAIPDVRPILLVDRTDRSIQSLQFGVRGIVSRDTPTHLVVKSIRTVASGGYWMPRESAPSLIEILAQAGSGPREQSRPCGLTARELDILALVVHGYSNRDAARKRSIAEDTVKQHLRNIFDKTGVSNRLELALFAVHHKLLTET